VFSPLDSPIPEQGDLSNRNPDNSAPAQNSNSTNTQTINGTSSDNGLEPFIREWTSDDPDILFKRVTIEAGKQVNNPRITIRGQCFAESCPPKISIGNYSNGVITGEYNYEINNTGNVVAYVLQYSEQNDKLHYIVLSGLANNTGIKDEGYLNCQNKCR
jgi:hypothetical protein